MMRKGLWVRLFCIAFLVVSALFLFRWIGEAETALRDSELNRGLLMVDSATQLLRSELSSLKSALYVMSFLPSDFRNGKEKGALTLEDMFFNLRKAYGPLISLCGLIDEEGVIVQAYPHSDLVGHRLRGFRPFELVKLGRIGIAGDPIPYFRERGLGIYVPSFDTDLGLRGVLFGVLDLGEFVNGRLGFIEKPWEVLILGGNGRSLYGEGIPDEILKGLIKRKDKGLLSEGGRLFAFNELPLEAWDSLYVVLHSSEEALFKGRKVFFDLARFLIAFVVASFSLVMIVFHRGKDEVAKGVETLSLERPVVEEDKDVEEGALPDLFEEFKRNFPGLLLEVDDALKVLSVGGDSGRIGLKEDAIGKDLKELLPLIDEEDLYYMLSTHKGKVKLGDRFYELLVVPTSVGRNVILGFDITEKVHKEDFLKRDWIFFVVGKLLLRERGCSVLRKLSPFMTSEMRRVDLISLLSELKEALSFLRLRLELDSGAPSVWVSPFELLKLLLTVMTLASEFDGDTLLRTDYLRDRATVSLEIRIMRGSKDIDEEGVELMMARGTAMENGWNLNLLRRVEDLSLILELPVHPFPGVI